MTGGRILIDGQDIQHVTLKSLREDIGIVQQDVYLFSGSVADNIAYGKPGATREEIIEAARLAGAERFISALKDGFDTYVGERGVKLSGGQKQRISIARALLKDAPILILDDSVSAVDTRTEKNHPRQPEKEPCRQDHSAHRAPHLDGWRDWIRSSSSRTAEWRPSAPHDRLYASCPEYRKMVDLQKLEDEVGGGNA